ncbi:RagB/SusD family nutrient uptake outer membrane protein [Sphingobacterium daejeonense]|uniref:RagB/SusD family nutrient uptake outer membrane protein n=1 Tax=Sphingobacterium daejeonense TaxID=371142 RepID=UPI0021A6C5C8|nr:RagB/SusD family nutrient uptake outer membrane protein [Sphingobacterium daejeonense]MCT1531354.1 RagB/SusD family nutrient uptake outer membrane protein [Sphingobacterium daejeonense]
MKKNIIKRLNWVVAIALLLQAQACNDFLDIKSDPTLLSPNSLGNLQGLLDDAVSMNFATNSFAEASADDYFLTSDNFNSLDQDSRNIYTWSNYLYTFDNDWAKSYNTVYNSNVVLDQLQKIDRSPENQTIWDNIKGSALFFRANSYLYSLWTYCKAYNEKTASSDLGIVIRENSDPTVESFRSSLSEGYQAVINDLRLAVRLLPSQPEHVMRPSKKSAYGVLARAYLSMRKYEEAFSYADSVLMLHPEVIDYNNEQHVASEDDFPFQRFNKETVFYSEQLPYATTLSYALIDSTLYSSYDDDDMRKKAFFKQDTDNYVNFKGSYSSNTNLFSGLTSAEMYLVRAECAARLGNTDDAIRDLEYLLKRRYRSQNFTVNTNWSTNELLTLILSERRKELVMRGLRWMDVKRLNVEGFGIVLRRKIDRELKVLQPNDPMYALPIPNDIVLISGIQQNPY